MKSSVAKEILKITVILPQLKKYRFVEYSLIQLELYNIGRFGSVPWSSRWFERKKKLWLIEMDLYKYRIYSLWAFIYLCLKKVFVEGTNDIEWCSGDNKTMAWSGIYVFHVLIHPILCSHQTLLIDPEVISTESRFRPTILFYTVL